MEILDGTESTLAAGLTRGHCPQRRRLVISSRGSGLRFWEALQFGLDGYFLWGFYAKPDTVSTDLQNCDFDIVRNDNLLIRPAGDNKHRIPRLGRAHHEAKNTRNSEKRVTLCRMTVQEPVAEPVFTPTILLFSLFFWQNTLVYLRT